MKGKQPVKRDINLLQREEEKSRKLWQTVVLALALIVAVGAFVEFAVLNRLETVRAAEAEAVTAERQLSEIRAVTADYPAVEEEYRTYTLAHQAVSRGADPLECLDLIEEELMARSLTSAFSVSPDLIAAEFSGVTLEEVSVIYSDLMKSELVAGVQVHTAVSEEEPAAGEQPPEDDAPAEDEAAPQAGRVTASMVIRLAVEEEEAQP